MGDLPSCESHFGLARRGGGPEKLNVRNADRMGLRWSSAEAGKDLDRD